MLLQLLAFAAAGLVEGKQHFVDELQHGFV